MNTALTHITKAQSSMIERLPKHEVIKIVRASKEHDVRVLTIEGAKALEKNAKQEYEKNLHIKLKEMEVIATQVLTSSCYKCKIKCHECVLYDMMSRFLIPGLNSENNCPYSYNEKSRFDQVECEGDDLVYREALEIHRKPIAKANRKNKKNRNRYDDPGEDYKYNFTPKGDE
ncbi:MAG: DUF5651 domain-containing protein [Sarcina sp.]